MHAQLNKKDRILHDFELSGNCYKVRLLLSLLGLEYRRMPVDLAGREQKSDWFLKLNPRGQVPVLVDCGKAYWDSSAIMVYLARSYGEEAEWFPSDVERQVRVLQWMSLAQNEILYGLARARAAYRFGRKVDMDDCQRLGEVALAALERGLAWGPWLVGDRPSLADVACYPYVALSHEGGISVGAYPAVMGWLERIEALEGWHGMPGLLGWRSARAPAGAEGAEHACKA